MPSHEAQEFYREAAAAASKRSNWCAMRPIPRNRVIKCALAVWPVGDPTQDDIPVSKEELISQVRTYYQQVYGNPLVMLILSVILKIVIELLIEWWKNREDKRAAIMECSRICNAAGTALDQCLE